MYNELKDRLEEFFRDLNFNEEKHLYTLKSTGEILPSTSRKIKSFCIPFDAKAISEKKAKKEGVSAESLRKEWKKKADDACNHGHKVHTFGELYPFNRSLKPSNKKEEAIVKFWDDLPDHIIPVVCELRMYHKKYRYAGTLDVLLYNKLTGLFIICDYKTNKDLFKNFKLKKLIGKFKNFLDNPFNKYQIQQNYYKIMLEQFGIPVEEMKIIWLKEDGNYEMYDCQDFSEELKSTFKV